MSYRYICNTKTTMISLRTLTRIITPQLTVSTQHLHTSNILLSSESADSDSSDDEKKKKTVAAPKANVATGTSVHKLNSLLQAMTQQGKVQSKVNVAVNPKKPIQSGPKIPNKQQNVTERLFEEKLTGAAKKVAVSLGGDTSKTESELLKKILTPSTQEPIDLSKLVLGMNVDRTKSTETETTTSRADRVRADMQRNSRYPPLQPKQMGQPRMRERIRTGEIPIAIKVDIDSGIPINIFNANSEVVLNTPTLSTWDLLEKKEHKLLVTHPPINFLEQMICWTEQGRLWRFPIDNEQDMHIGQEEHFSEHVFLEQHLEGWCPTKGPIRHFMELVCVGLSKNPYMFAKDKRDRIMWFKEYFDSKRNLLQELGAYGSAVDNQDKTQIES